MSASRANLPITHSVGLITISPAPRRDVTAMAEAHWRNPRSPANEAIRGAIKEIATKTKARARSTHKSSVLMDASSNPRKMATLAGLAKSPREAKNESVAAIRKIIAVR